MKSIDRTTTHFDIGVTTKVCQITWVEFRPALAVEEEYDGLRTEHGGGRFRTGSILEWSAPEYQRRAIDTAP